MKNIIKNFFKESYSLLWTIAGTALVLITMSGDVLKYALWISGAGLTIHFLGLLFIKGDENEKS
jgi:uncharacterized membrane protein